MNKAQQLLSDSGDEIDVSVRLQMMAERLHEASVELTDMVSQLRSVRTGEGDGDE